MIVEVENFLPEELVGELVAFSKTNTDWQLQAMQEHLPRKRIILPANERPIEIVHMWFEALPIFAHLNFMGVTLWKDDVDFKMKQHLDNAQVKIAVQIYLDNRKSPGTQFGNRLIQYGQNRGYIMYNNPDMLHGVPDQTPHEGRLSIYALFQ